MGDQATADTAAPTSEHHHHRPFGRAYWMLNSIEMFERLAYFGIRAVVPLYIMQATEPGGLHLTAMHKGWIYMWWAILQSWLPLFTGGIADRYGYKRVLVGAICANAIGYLMMALMHNYFGFFAGILVLATGTAFFKPALQGSIAQNLTKERSSLGWGIFYWVVNVGAVLASFVATMILGKPHSAEGWRNLFIASSLFTCCNLFLLLTFRDVPSGSDKSLNLTQVFARTIENIWPYWSVGGRFHALRGPFGVVLAVIGLAVFILHANVAEWLNLADYAGRISLIGLVAFFVGSVLATILEGGKFQWQLRLPIFLLIMSCFWMMMYQLWDLQPNFITDWIDSSPVAASLGGETWPGTMFWEYGDEGRLQVPQQILLNLNAALIVLLIIPISWAARNMRTLSAMLVGMLTATAGVLIAGLTQVGWVLLLGIVFFSLGEMWTGPKKNEYLGLIAPPGKKGLYLGYVNIPIGIGVGIGSWLGGFVYDHYGEKATLALKELAARPALIGRAARSIDWSDSLDRIPELLAVERDAAFPLAQEDLGQNAEAAAETLRRYYRYDDGQITNLALLYLVDTDEKLLARVRKGLAKKLIARVEKLESKEGEEQKADDADSSEGAATRPASAPTSGPTDAPQRRDLARDLRLLAERVESGDESFESLALARYIDDVPEWIDRKRVEALDLVRESINDERRPEDRIDDGAIIDLLWERYGNDPQLINNLALEYVAQETPLLADAIAAKITTIEIEDPVEDIEEHFGIDRTKSFYALSAAGADDPQAVEAALAKYAATDGDENDRYFAYLANLPNVRFKAIARRDWSRDVPLLETMVESDADAKAIVDERIDQVGFWVSITGAIGGLFGDAAEQTRYERLADRQALIQAALSAKDWSQTPDQARALLRLSVPEARTRVAMEVNKTNEAATSVLWQNYHPQYKVWLPFAAIGIAAAIALAIFGQMAKRWADMNA